MSLLMVSLLPIAHRTGRESCWVKFSLAAPPGATLCIPHHLWVRDYSASANWKGSWRAYSPLELEPGHTKRVLYTFHATDQVRSPGQKARDPGWIVGLEKERELLSEWLKNSGADESGIYRHLLLGEDTKVLIPFRILGLFRLLTTSGIHLIALAAWLGFLLGVLLRLTGLSASIALALRGVLTAALWCWSWLLAGARWAMLRPLLYLALRSGGKRAGIRWNERAVFALAILLDFACGIMSAATHHEAIRHTVLEPARLFYWIAAGTAVSIARSRRSSSRIRIYAEISFGVWIVIAVYLLAEERFTALLSPFLAWILLPLIAGVVYPALVLRSLLPQNLAQLVPDLTLLLGYSHHLIEYLGRLSLECESVWWVPRIFLLVAMICSGAVWLFPKPWRLKIGAATALILTVAGFIHHSPSSQPGFATKVEQLDVGQGDGALVLGSDGEAGLIDSGSAHSLNELQWLQVLMANGLDRIDWMAATHLDEDHAGGVRTLSEVANIGCATTSAAEMTSPRGKRWKIDLESHGVTVSENLEDCIPFPALGPPQPRQLRRAPAHSPSHAHSANENMSAFLIPLEGGGFYLSAGDATARDELRIGSWAAELARKLEPGPRVLKLSHHGSKTSSNPQFLREMAPTEAWISDGVGNSYGHPSPVIVERIREIGIPLHRTDEEGTLIIQGLTKY